MNLSDWINNLVMLRTLHGNLAIEFFVKIADSFIPVMPEATGWSDDMRAVCVIMIQDPNRTGQIIDIREGRYDASNFDGTQEIGVGTPKT